ncbi:MAG: alpha-mannosidase [Clostridia bacterium]|nr:alpha-mannosidase [Clostridia bacterium]
MKEVHLIANAHIDPIWQWDWQEGVSAVLSTFQSAVNLAEQFDYIFCHNEVTVYKYVEEYAPALFEQIQKLAARGKWHIMGGWYLQPDCNMPSGESFVRQIQEGKRYFKEKFGVEPTTAIGFDAFGHTVGLVQIIKKCGQDSYLFVRPHLHEMNYPAQRFVWEGLDGSEIKACRAASYNSPLGFAVKCITDRVALLDDEVVCVLWGVGNHGGGPSAKDLAEIAEMQKESENKYIHSTPEAFFANIQPTARLNTSLRISMPGCYTSMYRLKKKHALLENELWLTEKMLSVAYAKGALKEYPEENIHTIVEDLLNAEFHDVLPGTSVQCGEDNGLKLLDHGLLEVERLKTKAYFALASTQEVAREGEYPVVVFNPHPYTVKENIECEFMLADQNWSKDIVSRLSVCDEKGNKVKYQIVKEESNLNLDWRKRVIFEAELAPMKLSRYSVFAEFVEKKQEERTKDLLFDDGRKIVEIDGETGLLKRYAIDGVEYVKNGFLPVMFDDNPDPWAMKPFQLARLGDNESPFTLSQKPSGVFEGLRSIQVIEDGEIYLGIEAFFEKENTRARIGYKIYKNNDYVDVDVTVFMGDANKFVKLKVPVCVQGKLIGQTAFGTEELYTDARENVAHRFVAIDAGEKCLAVMNTGVYGSHYENGALYLSLVRGVSYCAHPISDRPILPNDRFVKKIDQGENSYSFRLGVVDRNQLERVTQEFTQKPYGLNIFPTKPETIVLKDFNVSLEDETVSLVTLKKADGREGLLFRLLNNTGDEVSTALSVCGVRLPLQFRKYEVKTVLYENGELKELEQLII